MPRLPLLAILAGFAALTCGGAVTSAQESGGVVLTPEAFKADNAQGQVLDHVLARAQQIQQLRLLNLTGGSGTSSNLANPAAASSNSDPLAIGAARSDALSLASALRQRAIKTNGPIFQQQLVENYQLTDNSRFTDNSLTVNAPNSSVSVGSNNVVRQQVSTSTATSPTGSATASAGVTTPGNHHGKGKGKTSAGQTSQTATSEATSAGGTAQAVAINTDITSRANN
jgi:hypothetical protein